MYIGGKDPANTYIGSITFVSRLMIYCNLRDLVCQLPDHRKADGEFR
jgi:hypothetical protein